MAVSIPTITSGTQYVGGLNPRQLVIDMENEIKKGFGDEVVFTTLTREAGGMITAEQRLHEWLEDSLAPSTAQVTTATAAGVTAIYCTPANAVLKDQVIFCPATGDAFVCNEAVGGTANAGQIVVRGLNGTGGTQFALAVGQTLVFGTQSQMEGDGLPSFLFTAKTNWSTLVQQIDEIMFLATDFALGAKKYGEEERAAQHVKKFIEFWRKFNLQCYLGQQATDSSSTAPRVFMQGLDQWLSSVTNDVSKLAGGITLATLGEIIRPTTLYGVPMKGNTLLAGQNLYRAISSFPIGTVRITDPGASQIQWGVTVSKLNTPYGIINIVRDPLLSQEWGLADRGYVIHPEYIKQIEMDGRNPNAKLAIRTNIQNPTEFHIVRDVLTGTRGFMVEMSSSTPIHRRIIGAN